MRRTLLLSCTAAAITLALSACNKPEEAYTPTDEPAPAAVETAPAPEPMTEPAPTDPMTPDPNAPPVDPNAPPADPMQTPPTSPEEPPASSDPAPPTS